MIKKVGAILLSMMFLNNYGQVIDSVGSNSVIKDEVKVQKFKIKKLYAPAALMLTGFLLNDNNQESLKNEIVEERNEHFLNFSSHVDDVLQFSPIIAAYSLDAFGIKSKNDFANRTAILLKGEIMTLGSVFIIKHLAHETRPDGSNNQSFPSGHTAQAFAAATFLSEEYKDQFSWMPYVAYSVAGSVGVFRMVNNKHYISDVLFGAGLGLLSMKLSYWTHRYKWNKKNRDEATYNNYIKNEKLLY